MSDQYDYRPHVRRNVTRKWAQAQLVDYGGDDWGDDGYGPEEPEQQPLSQDRRSFTNPAALNTSHRLSFDRNEEQRVYSAGARTNTGFSTLPSSSRFYAGQQQPAPAPSHQPPYAQQPYEQPARSQPVYQQPIHGRPSHQLPSFAPSVHTRQSSDVPGMASIDSYGSRPESRGSNTTQRGFPPRKSSLSQTESPMVQNLPPQSQPSAAEHETPTPRLIRPADIYKRMEEEKERERRSHDSGRPSMDSIDRDVAPNQQPTQAPPADATVTKRLNPNLETVAERRSEYDVDSHVRRSPSESPTERRSAGQTSSPPDDTDLDHHPSIASASSRYTDRPDPVSEFSSAAPSRNVSLNQQQVPDQRPTLPPIGRTSTWGSDLFRTSDPTPSEQQQGPPVPPKDDSPERPALQHQPSSGYRTMVNDAFQAENQKPGSPARTENSIQRSNTTSTSEISPIVGKSTEHEWDRALADNAARAQNRGWDQDEELPTPRRLGTNRRDSPSPARRPRSAEAPPVPEPQSAVVAEDSSPEASRSTTREDHDTTAMPSDHNPPGNEQSSRLGPDPTPRLAPTPLQKQDTGASKVSDQSNMRTASEEWEQWSAARKDFHAQHGVQDSNPPTPGMTSSEASTPGPAFDSLDKSMHMPAGGASNENLKPYGLSKLPPSIRPQMARDESFRPILPGGWQSSTSIQKAEFPQAATMSQQQPSSRNFTARTESTESVPTAGAPRDKDWRSQYSSGPQAKAFAAASAAGNALAGIFSGPSLTSSRTDSEVSSINDPDEGPMGRNRDPDMKSRDFADPPTPEEPQRSAQSTTKDFASPSASTNEDAQITPRAHQRPFGRDNGSERRGMEPTPIVMSRQGTARSHTSSIENQSPSKESERWWSDDDESDTAASAPAPLRTKRMSTAELDKQARPSIPHGPEREDSDSQPDADQLHSDIVKSLTPKSSAIRPNDATTLRASERSPTREQASRVSPPFAAAALAMSPSRDYQALQDQNAWKPLSTPPSKPQSPNIETMSRDLSNVQPSTNDPQPAYQSSAPNTQGPPVPTTGPVQSGYGGVSNSVSTPAKATDESTPYSKPDITPTKDFSIMPEFNEGPVLAPFSYGQPSTLEPVSATNSERKVSTDSERTPAVGQFPATPSADEAITTPFAANTPRQESEISRPSSAASSLSRGKPALTGARDTSRPSTPLRAHYNISVSSLPSTPQATASTSKPFSSYDPKRSFPSDQIPFKQISNMGSAQQRIKAYNDNREAYAQPIGHLENWLAFMNTNERADAFTTPRPANNQYATPSPRNAHSTSGSVGGSKQMQEDGKKLLAAASKYGGKAGILGKGLFSKGKEKLRTVSANQKGSILGRKNNQSVPELNQPSSYVNSSAPHLPTPPQMTPIDQSSLSAYFAPTESERSADQMHTTGAKALEPPFSPVSEVSTNQLDERNGLKREISAVSEDQKPQSNSEAKPKNSTLLSDQQALSTEAQDSSKSVGAVSTLGNDNGQPSMDTLTARNPQHIRRTSSVSDVSSVSDAPGRRDSLLARTVSPPNNRLVSYQPTSSLSKPPFSADGITLAESQPQHAPSSSTATESKVAEAQQDRQEEQTLPAYNPQENRPPRIEEGARIVPVARLGQDQDVRVEPQRPFSFVGSESLLHTSSGTAYSIDNPGVNTGMSSLNQHPRDPYSRQANNQHLGQIAQSERPGDIENPLPSARRDPADLAGRTSEEFARLRQQQQPPIQTQPQGSQQFRIPGPYGQELRSPKPKTSPPILDQFRTTPTATNGPQDNVFDARNVSAPRVEPDTRSSAPHPGPLSQHPPQPPVVSLTPRMQHMDDDRGGRPKQSRLHSLFGRSRSKSRSQRLQKEKQLPVEPQPELGGRRDSFFKLNSRNNISRDSNGVPASAPSRDQQQYRYDELAQHDDQVSSRPGPGPRRLSKQLFSSTSFNQSGENVGYGQNISEAIPGKKKRFSGLFGKTSPRNDSAPTQARSPTRASTLPLSTQQPSLPQTFHGQITVHQDQAPSTDFPHGMHPAKDTNPPQTDRQDLSQAGHVNARQNDRQFQGQLPPAEGYYGAPQDTNTWQTDRPQDQPRQESYGEPNDSYKSHSNPNVLPQQPLRLGGSPYQHVSVPHQSALGQGAQNNVYTQPRPDLRVNTGSPAPGSAPPAPSSYLTGRQGPQSQSATLPSLASLQANAYHQARPVQEYRPPSTRASRDISYGSSPVSQQHYGQTPQETSKIAPRVRTLHTRSRSPKLGRRSSGDLNAEYSETALSDSPVKDLGTFSNKNVTPVHGIRRPSEDQEKPWAITLPGDEHDRKTQTSDPASATSSKAREVRRIMIERTGATPVQSPQGETRPQTVAERFMGVPDTKTAPTASAAVKNILAVTAPSTPSVTLSRKSSRTNNPKMVDPNVQRNLNVREEIHPTSESGSLSGVSREPSQRRGLAAAGAEIKPSPTPPVPSISPLPDNERNVLNTSGPVTGFAPPVGNRLSQHVEAPKKTLHIATNGDKPSEVHEMPGSRPDGYESEEEVVMSATAGPGQDWQPLFEPWDD